MTALQKRMIGWSALSVCVVTLFWTTWYLIAGSVPVTTFVGLWNYVFDLPFGISRWWDCLFVVPLAILSVGIIADIKKVDTFLDDLFGHLNYGLDYLLAFGFIVIMASYVALALLLGFAIALVVCLPASLLLVLITFTGNSFIEIIKILARVIKKYVPIFIKNWLLAKDN